MENLTLLLPFHSIFPSFSVGNLDIISLISFLICREVLVHDQVVRYLYSVFWLLLLGRAAISNKSTAVLHLLLDGNLISSPLHMQWFLYGSK